MFTNALRVQSHLNRLVPTSSNTISSRTYSPTLFCRCQNHHLPAGGSRRFTAALGNQLYSESLEPNFIELRSRYYWYRTTDNSNLSFCPEVRWSAHTRLSVPMHLSYNDDLLLRAFTCPVCPVSLFGSLRTTTFPYACCFLIARDSGVRFVSEVET